MEMKVKHTFVINQSIKEALNDLDTTSLSRLNSSLTTNSLCVLATVTFSLLFKRYLFSSALCIGPLHMLCPVFGPLSSASLPPNNWLMNELPLLQIGGTQLERCPLNLFLLPGHIAKTHSPFTLHLGWDHVIHSPWENVCEVSVTPGWGKSECVRCCQSISLLWASHVEGSRTVIYKKPGCPSCCLEDWSTGIRLLNQEYPYWCCVSLATDIWGHLE